MIRDSTRSRAASAPAGATWRGVLRGATGRWPGPAAHVHGLHGVGRQRCGAPGRPPSIRSAGATGAGGGAPRSRAGRRQAWRAARISPEAVSLALTSSNVPCSSPSSRASWSNLAAGGRSRLSIARTCTPAEPGTGQPGEMGGVADQPFAGGRPLQGDHDDRGRHRLADAVSGGERHDRTGNRVIEPELRELLQRGEIREPERGTASHPPRSSGTTRPGPAGAAAPQAPG